MKKIITLIIIFATCTVIRAQIPSNCIEIESILVDACGSPEGENEMVRFQVGPAPINLASMTVLWPNNSWLGLCQNATTASVVATWNSTITQCGLLIEPIGGIIPAGEHVIMVSSTNVIPGANSFAGLSDTVYVIFQCAGNTNGHFANFGIGLRTLEIDFPGCSDIVTYDRALLEDMLGVHVAADGATVNFDWGGIPDYVNIGCAAPVIPLVVNAGADQPGFCPGDTVFLSASTMGSFSSFSWTGGTGTFINSGSTNASYIIGAGDISPVGLYFSATNCNGTITDTLQILLSSPSPVFITPGGPLTICTEDSVTLTANGPGPFTWNTSATTSTITVTTLGTYIVTQTSSCGNSSDTVIVTLSGGPPVATITPMGSTALCQGSVLTLNGGGIGNYLWSTSDITPSINANLAGNYYLIVSNSCGSDTAYITLTANANPQANISPSSPINLCAGSVDVTASGTGSFTWSTGGTGTSESFNTPGNFYVVANNVCGTDTAFFTIVGGSITAGFTATPINGSSPLPVNFSNTSSGADTYQWIFGDGGTSNLQDPSFTYTHPGTYIATLIATNAGGCVDTAYLTITVDSCLYAIKIPNVFTPDGNGMNDAFYVTATCSDVFHAYIFDRWGIQVFEYDDVSGNWNGSTLTGSNVTLGVYSYIIYLKDYNGDEHQYSGFIHVFD